MPKQKKAEPTLKELKQEAHQALIGTTPGPWVTEGGCIWGYENSQEERKDGGGTSEVCQIPQGKDKRSRDTDLILFAKNSLPSLVSALDALLGKQAEKKKVVPRRGATQDEVIAVMRGCLLGEEVSPDRIAHTFKELREKINTATNQPGSSPNAAFADDWLSGVVQQTRVDPLAEALGVTQNLLRSDIGEPLKQNLHRLTHLLEEAQERE